MTETQKTDTAATTADNSTTAPVATLAMVTLDAPNAAVLGEFYSSLLGWPIAYSDESYAMLTGPSHALGIGTIPDYQRPSWPDDGHKQFHLDLAADDIHAAADRCVELGATRAEPQPGETWVVLLDPAGHPFCISDAKNWG
ncbi:VOC family protein [Brevibacterium sediminis]|uniref:VOC family protein n=1 Tax=Brevibacterium sediminis TaxID=1857024 RepID=A0A5C4WZ80_9MICO|nr:VOC family protein [Brevibacterium sediminis]TNM53348.1 VOC family protein [Brevibacterium sediminis]